MTSLSWLTIVDVPEEPAFQTHGSKYTLSNSTVRSPEGVLELPGASTITGFDIENSSRKADRRPPIISFFPTTAQVANFSDQRPRRTLGGIITRK